MIKKIIITLLLIISLIGIITSSYNIFKWKKDNAKTQKQIEVQKEEAEVKEEFILVENNDNNVTTNKDNNKSSENVSFLTVNIKKLQQTNSDIKGWIKVNGTKIDYSFVQTDNNSFYLKHSVDKSNSKAGWVFMDFRNNLKELDKNTILYAHGRADGSMFGSLRKTLKNDWLNNKDNHYIKLTTEYDKMIWKVFSVYSINETDDYLSTNFPINYDKFLDMIKNRSIYDFNETLNEDDKIITLSTCKNNKVRIVMHAKLIKIEPYN